MSYNWNVSWYIRGSDSITGYHIKEGVVTEKRVVISLGEPVS